MCVCVGWGGVGDATCPTWCRSFIPQDLTVEVLPDQQKITFTLNASISPGECHCVIRQGWLWLALCMHVDVSSGCCYLFTGKEALTETIIMQKHV